MTTKLRKNNTSGFSLIEIIVVILIFAAVMLVAVPAINSSLRDAREQRRNSNVQILNQAAERARLAGQVGPGTYGTDKVAALNWYLSERILQSNPIDLEGIYFFWGIWEKNQFPNEEAILQALAPRQSTPEENVQSMLDDWGASSPEEIAEWFGFVSGDVQAMLDSIGATTLDEYAQYWGSPNFEQWALDWFGPGTSPEQAAAWMGYFVPGSEGDPEAFAVSQGYASFQEMADAQYSSIRKPTLTEAQIREISTSIPTISPSTFEQITQNPSATKGENLVAIQNAFADALENGSLSSWTESEIQNPFWTLLQQAHLQNNGNGEFLSLMDFSQIDLTGRNLANTNLRGANITGTQLNAATEIHSANLQGLDLNGFDPTGKNLNAVKFTDATGITAAQLTSAADLRNADLTGLDFSDASFQGIDLQGVQIRGAQNFDGTQLNGATKVKGARLENLDLSNWTDIPYSGNWQTQVTSLAGSTINRDIWSANQLIRNADISGVDLSFLDGTNAPPGFITNWTGAIVTGHTIRNMNNFYWNNMGTMDMTGFIWDGKNLAGSDMRYVQNMTGADLNRVAGVVHDSRGINVSGRDLTGWTPSYSINGVNASNSTGLTPEGIANATDIRGLQLTGTGITKAELDAALNAVGKDPTSGNFNTATVKF